MVMGIEFAQKDFCPWVISPAFNGVVENPVFQNFMMWHIGTLVEFQIDFNEIVWRSGG